MKYVKIHDLKPYLGIKTLYDFACIIDNVRVETMINIRKLENELWEAADALRAGSKLTSNQYCMPVLGLIFLRYAYSRFKLVEAEILKDRPVRNGRVMPVEASDFKAKSALYLPIEAQYDYLLNLPEDIKGSALTSKDGQVMTSLGEVVNNAMALIEDQSAQLTGILPKNYTDFSDELLAEILRIFNNSALDEVGGDIIGRIYEYFLNKFAKNIASDDGVFFTPKSLVKMIVNVLEPTHGTLFDPACGSGGMFIQSGDFVNSHGMNANSAMTFYGQEKVEYNAQLCLMNMAVHGLTGVIKSGDEGNSFYNDAHQLDGRCDYIMANPPFNVDKVKSESTLAAGRLPFGMPSINNKSKEISNANYLWISYFYSYLNDTGRAGFVMASSATDSQGKDKDIRESLVKTGAVDVMVSVGNNFFYTKSLPCSLWFFDKAKLEAIKDKVLFIDARNYYTVVDRTLNEWTEWQLKNLNAIVWLYRGEVEKYIALLNEYRQILGEDQSFAGYIESLSEQVKAIEAEGKQAVADAGRSKGKKVQQEYDEKVKTVKEILTIAQEAQWLYEKFGDGEYVDIPGLCKIAYITNEAKGDNEGISIEDKNWSLTPGAYVGVAPVEDDGVNFEERMAEIHEELLALQQESNILMETISNNMKEMGL
jgi:putative modification enzyme transmembrane protein